MGLVAGTSGVAVADAVAMVGSCIEGVRDGADVNDANSPVSDAVGRGCGGAEGNAGSGRASNSGRTVSKIS